jgi:hypothetical protein
VKLVSVASHTTERGDDEDDEDKETQAIQRTPPQERFLQKDSDDLWTLVPLPDQGTVRHADLGLALHTYITQQWSMNIFTSSWAFS